MMVRKEMNEPEMVFLPPTLKWIFPWSLSSNDSNREWGILRQLEQTVLVYPTPLTYSFMAGETIKDNSEFVAKVTDDQLQAGSLAGHIAIKSPSGKEYIVQGATQGQEKQLNLTFPAMEQVGRYRWYGWLYATDNFNQRELIFSLPERSFALAAQMQLTKDLQQLKQEELVKQQQEKIKQQQLAGSKTTR